MDNKTNPAVNSAQSHLEGNEVNSQGGNIAIGNTTTQEIKVLIQQILLPGPTPTGLQKDLLGYIIPKMVKSDPLLERGVLAAEPQALNQFDQLLQQWMGDPQFVNLLKLAIAEKESKSDGATEIRGNKVKARKSVNLETDTIGGRATTMENNKLESIEEDVNIKIKNTR